VVCPILVPLDTCNKAADHLIEWFGPEELQRAVGGERWWQVRYLDGIEAEWIALREHLPPLVNDPKKSKKESEISLLDNLETVLVRAHYCFTHNAANTI
jgi:hypothetical protein